MPACHRCGADNLPGSRYCSTCGTALRDPAAGLESERKVVTVVFCDLVGFTGLAERRDPEDVDRLLAPFHTGVRTQLERFGGTVEKFIGDAAMAVFGAPVAHEDDAERAVRAAFAIQEAVRGLGNRELDLHVRIGIATGEVFVRLGADPGLGDAAVAGDVVNTAARLQQAAPVDAIVVGEGTVRATRGVVEYRALAPVSAKGKREPVPAWEAVAVRSRPEETPGRRPTPLVGRVEELEVLRAAATGARERRAARIVTLVGDPGIGKSRLARELLELLAAERTGFRWLVGRSAPYGAGATFSALADVVKAEAGILETDVAQVAAERLARSVRATVADEGEAAWIERHLRPLVGLSGETDRRESFAAWRRYLTGVAVASGLLVMCFEDVQWADEGLLDFIEHLDEWGEGAPLLVVCTARAELFERRPDWPGAVPLRPLDAGQTVTLFGALLAGVDVRGEAWPKLLAAAAGNPLYAEEYAQMLRERPRAGEPPLPESVAAVVASRIDNLRPGEKALLQDAAVVGRSFWAGALETVSGRPRDEVERLLGDLERRGLVLRAPVSVIAGEPQYAFSHVLVRDIAYGQIPHRERVERHRATAGWVSALAPDRSASTAEMAAHHYRSALGYARLRESQDELEALARAAFRTAGDHAFALGGFAAAAGLYEEAVALWPADDPGLPSLRLALGTSRFRAEGGGEEELELAATGLEALGDPSRPPRRPSCSVRFASDEATWQARSPVSSGRPVRSWRGLPRGRRRCCSARSRGSARPSTSAWRRSGSVGKR